MYLEPYDLELIKEKLDKAQKSARVRKFSIEEVDNLIEKVEKITIELVKEYPEGIFNFILTNAEKDLTATHISGQINEKGLVDLDTLDVYREKGLIFNKITLVNFRDIIKGEDETTYFIKKYNCTYGGNIYL